MEIQRSSTDPLKNEGSVLRFVGGSISHFARQVCHDLLDNYPRSCRRCRATDQIPYTRIHWRAAWMMSCPVHGEMLDPFYQRAENPAASYEWMPARPASAELLALDRLTLMAVTTGMVDLPSGGRVHAGIWLRTMRTLIDEMTRPATLLRRGGYDRVTQIWRETGRQFHWSIGRLVPFEAMLVDRREFVLTITSIAASALFSGKLTAIEENASTVLRPPPRMDLPDLLSPQPPRCRWPRGAWWDDRISEARRDPQVAWSVRTLLNMSAGRQQRAEMDSYLENDRRSDREESARFASRLR